jgi:hypothetical protein
MADIDEEEKFIQDSSKPKKKVKKDRDEEY